MSEEPIFSKRLENLIIPSVGLIPRGFMQFNYHLSAGHW